MKKLLILALTLGLPSTVSAALITSIFVNGEQWDSEEFVLLGDVVTVKWTLTEELFGGVSGLQYSVSHGLLLEEGGFLSSSEALIANTLTAEQLDGGIQITGGASGAPFPARDIFEINFVVPEHPVPYIILLDTVAGGMNCVDGEAVEGPEDNFPYDEVYVVPEPTTMILLVIGGSVVTGIKRRT